MFKKIEKTPNLVEQEKKELTIYDEYKIGDTLGGFGGYLQYSKPAKGLNGKSGMMANIFGENGRDSDMIAALNLTKFLNIPIKVSIWSIKDKNGKILKDKNSKKFPKISQFIAYIHRPTSSVNGLTARFFGEDGGNADAINELNKTENNGNLVFCLIQLAENNSLLSEIETTDPEDELLEESVKLTPIELKKLEKKQEKYKEADNILAMNNFYGSVKILDILGDNEDYEKWLLEQECIVDHKKSNNIKLYHLSENKAYSAIPLNEKYISQIQTGELAESQEISDVNGYLKQWNKYLNQEYVRVKLKERLGIPNEYYLDPNALYNWAVKVGVSKLIPIHYTHFLDKKLL